MNSRKTASVMTAGILILGVLSQAQEPALRTTLPTEMAKKSEEVDGPLSKKLSLNVGVRNRSLEDKYVNSKFSGLSFNLVGETKLTDVVGANIDIIMISSAGAYSSLYTGEGKPFNFILLSEASMSFIPVSFFTVKAGLIPVEVSPIVSTMDSPGFPGLKEVLTGEGDSIKAELFASQSIPAADSAEVKYADGGVNTRLLITGLSLSNNPQDKEDFTAKISASRFDFQNLTAGGASDSRYLGNTTVDLGPNAARFRYEFKGYEGALGLENKFSNSFKLGLNGSYLENQEAPKGFNKSYLYKLKATYTGSKMAFTPSWGYMYNESDSLPAAYTSFAYSNNNRFGQVVSLKTEWLKQKFSITGTWVQANVIQEKSFMADRNIFTLNMEAKYDLL